MTATDSERELTLTGVGSDQRRTLLDAAGNDPHDFGIRTTIDVTSVTEDNVGDLLDALLEVQQEMADYGAYDEAEAASRTYDMIREQARAEGLVK
ncbi:hypothetical protein [Natronorubrum sp. FCH18a]|uniref:hypothetical protein n=1 Tax=Natronorubrum sp. FCH18a TaxID=3447018 RepID=UPI003F5155BC